MVDSIKSQSSQSQATSATRESSKANINASRESTKSASSESTITSAAQAAKEVPAVVNVQKRGGAAQVGQLVDNLNDAVKYSREALNALQGVADAANKVPEADVVREFAKDLDRLKSDIIDLLANLSNRADTAGVIGANLEAADAKLEDVEKAQAKAQSLSFDVDQALGAHGEGLTVERVAALLAD